MNLLFSKDLVWDTVLEASVGLQSGDIGFSLGDSYEMTVQGDLTTKVTERISLFVQTAYNGSVDPRFANNILVGGGGLLNLTETITIYGSYNASVVKPAPLLHPIGHSLCLLGSFLFLTAPINRGFISCRKINPNIIHHIERIGYGCFYFITINKIYECTSRNYNFST